MNISLEYILDKSIEYYKTLADLFWSEVYDEYTDEHQLSAEQIEVIKYVPEYAVIYAMHQLENRWTEAEPYILQDPNSAAEYAHRVIEGRWREAEKNIIQNMKAAVYYAEYVIKNRWPELEAKLLSHYHYDMQINEVMEYDSVDMEITVTTLRPQSTGASKRPTFEYVIDYAAFVLCDRWPEAEELLIKNPLDAATYAIYVINDRWPEAEPIIRSDETVWVNYKLGLNKQCNISNDICYKM